MTHEMQTGYLEFNGAQIYYEVEGDGPPLTLVHAGVAHLRMWDGQVAAWAERFRVIRYDTRGFGKTRTQDVPYSNVDDLAALLDHLRVERTHLLGLSRGALISLDFTLEHPERVASLTWIAGGIRGIELDDDPRLLAMWPEMERLEEAREWPALVELETQVWTDGPGQPKDRVDPGLRAQMIAWNMENYLAEQDAEQLIRPDWDAERVAEISAPTLLMWGTLDESPVGEAGSYLAEHIPGAESHTFEGVAHMVNLERPREVNEIVLDFVSRADAG